MRREKITIYVGFTDDDMVRLSPLLRPEEVMRLPVHQSLIMRTGHAPMKAGQCVWYLEKGVSSNVLQPIIIPVQPLHRDHNKENSKQFDR